MEFGIFVPQGWRVDLVGIDPSEHWRVMNALAQSADDGPWASLWVYRFSDGFGTPEQIVERLRERATHGLGYAIHYFPEAAYDTSGISLFEREVIPHL